MRCFFLSVFLSLAAVSAAAQIPSPPAPQPDAPSCKASGFERATVNKVTDRLLDMGFVGFEKMTLVEGCYRVEARNPAGDVVLLTFDEAGELIALGLGTGGAHPRFAPPRDGIREVD
jgi:hypothetical protein